VNIVPNWHDRVGAAVPFTRYRAFGDTELIKPCLRMSFGALDFLRSPVLSSELIGKGLDICRP
jgi:hypothetical protein